ncbi:MAG: HPF/RaiA family ribosome-associated protein [Crocinitomicaceae bacterium]|nr:HPF/RaiA family ribosome-associated protein [Crocinitomicaceae bacterium]
MTIQFNTDKTIEGSERHQNYFTPIIQEGLKRYDSQITRVEVHISDENGKKDGFNDMLCTLEVRLEGQKPTAVKSQANTVEKAVSGAIDKMKASLDTILGKLQNH